MKGISTHRTQENQSRHVGRHGNVGHIPHRIITGTVKRDTPPVTTLMTAVGEKTMFRVQMVAVFIVATVQMHPAPWSGKTTPM